MTVESSEPSSSDRTLTVRASPPYAAEPRYGQSDAHRTRVGAREVTVARVLVVEDEPGIALGLEDTLRIDGHDVTVVTDGVRAGRVATEQSFDLILLDVMLPGRSGFDVCRDLRRLELASPIKRKRSLLVQQLGTRSASVKVNSANVRDPPRVRDMSANHRISSGPAHARLRTSQ